MWDLAAIAILSIFVLLLLFNNIRLQIRNKRLVIKLAQEIVDKKIISDRLSEELSAQSSKNLEQSDGFLKFISQSRDWAFDYIEKVQAALLVFKNKVEPQILYAKTYGTVSGESPHTIIIDRISDAYDDLVKVMPEDSQDNVVK